jgi:hypothetical protein
MKNLSLCKRLVHEDFAGRKKNLTKLFTAKRPADYIAGNMSLQ